MTTAFENRALPLIARGIPVIPLRPRSKVAFFTKWQEIASTDPTKIKEWGEAYPEANVASVAKAQPDGFWFLEIDREEYTKVIEAETGKSIPPTMMVRSSPGRGHFYFKQTHASIAMGNVQGKDDAGNETWSARVDNRYVVGPGSIHPATGREYEVIRNAEIVAAPDWLEEWCVSKLAVSQEVTESGQPSWVSNAPPWIQKLNYLDGDVTSVLEMCPHINAGGRNTTLASLAGKLHQLGWTDENVLYCLNVVNFDMCHPSLLLSEVKTIAHSICRYPVNIVTIDGHPPGYAARAEESLVVSIGRINPNLEADQVKQLISQIKGYGQKQPIEDEQVNASEILSAPSINYLPEGCFASTRLSDLYDKFFKPSDWPIELALPALVTAASVVVPRTQRPEGGLVIYADDPMSNLYTALIGDVNVGKTQVARWAAQAIGIYKEPIGPYYFESQFGSAEQMLKSLAKKQEQFTNRTVLVNPDEWAQMFAKMAIPDATFPMVLTTLFYRRNYSFTLGGTGGGKDYSLNLALSLIGGIVEQDFDIVFGAKTLGGLYDRFLFGRAPDNFRWNYRPCPIPDVPYFKSWDMKSVRQDGSVFEVVKSWGQKKYGRITEICTRIATIFAAVDTRSEITGMDLEVLEPLALYQVGLRQMFKPNAGETHEAMFANKALTWINKNAPTWVPISRLKQHLWKIEERLGPNVAERTLSSLARGGRIDLWLAAGDNPMPSDYQGPRVRIGLVRRVK